MHCSPRFPVPAITIALFFYHMWLIKYSTKRIDVSSCLISDRINEPDLFLPTETDLLLPALTGPLTARRKGTQREIYTFTHFGRSVYNFDLFITYRDIYHDFGIISLYSYLHKPCKSVGDFKVKSDKFFMFREQCLKARSGRHVDIFMQ